MGKKRKTTWRDDIEAFKEDFEMMSEEDIVGYRQAFWPGGSGMSNSVRVRFIALLELAAAASGRKLPRDEEQDQIRSTRAQ